jgi:hypothetical protein
VRSRPRWRQSWADQEPLHWGSNTLPGQDGIYGLSAYRVDDHWLLVTLGLSELFGKESDDPATSGWGVELTMRIPASESQPPGWALRLLDTLGRHVFSGEGSLGVGHRMDARGPITGEPGSRLTGLAFVEDPVLGNIDTPNGALQFLTVVGVTADELGRMKASSTEQIIRELADVSPLLITDVLR